MDQIGGVLTFCHFMCHLQDTSATCHNLYQVLPLAVCVDAASTPARYETCDPTCPANSTGNHLEPDPWGAITAQCNSTQQTRSGGMVCQRKSVTLHCKPWGQCPGLVLPMVHTGAQLWAGLHQIHVMSLAAEAWYAAALRWGLRSLHKAVEC